MEVMRGGLWGSNWRLPRFGRAEEVMRKVGVVVMIMKMMMVVAVVVMVKLIGKGFKEEKDKIICDS